MCVIDFLCKWQSCVKRLMRKFIDKHQLIFTYWLSVKNMKNNEKFISKWILKQDIFPRFKNPISNAINLHKFSLRSDKFKIISLNFPITPINISSFLHPKFSAYLASTNFSFPNFPIQCHSTDLFHVIFPFLPKHIQVVVSFFWRKQNIKKNYSIEMKMKLPSEA